MSLRLLLPVLVLMFAACGRTAPPDDAPASADTAAASEPARPSLPALLGAERPRGVDTLAVLDRLPAPGRVEVETRENRHVPGAVDTLRTRHYQGLALTVRHAAGGKELLQRVHVTGERYATGEGLRVGLPRAEAERLLGRPTRTEQGVAVYEQGEPTPDLLRVRYQSGRVAALTWSFYVD